MLYLNYRAQKKMSTVLAWENSKKAMLDAELKKIEVKIIGVFTYLTFFEYYL